jgi:predicted alpha/beta-fold hydrolase
LGFFKEKSFFKGGVAVSAPLDFALCSKLIQKTNYDYLVARILGKKVNIIRKAYDNIPKENGIQLDKAINAKNLREFDDALTIKIYNFKTVDDYYREISSKLRLPFVKQPLLILNSMDDKISFFEAVPI